MAVRIASRRGSADLIPGVLGGVLVLTAGLTAITQYVAWSYRFAPALGAPLMRAGGWPFFGNAYAPWASLVWLGRADGRCWSRYLHRAACDAATLDMLHRAHFLLLGSLLAAAVVTVLIATIADVAFEAQRMNRRRRVPPEPATDRPNFTIEVGTATGKLMTFGHGAAVSSTTALRLEGDDAAKNIAIYGGIGSGKTTRAINRYANQSLRQNTKTFSLNAATRATTRFGAQILSALAPSSGHKPTPSIAHES